MLKGLLLSVAVPSVSLGQYMGKFGGAIGGPNKLGVGNVKYQHTKYGNPMHTKKQKLATEIKVPKCPKGYENKQGYCVRPESIDPVDVCPEGAIDDGEQCLLVKPGTVLCEQGEYIGDLICRVTQSLDGVYKCPEGSIEEGDKCLVGGLLEYCPAGTAEQDNGKCMETVAREYFCLPEQQDVGDLCLFRKYEDLEYICPENTTLLDGECIAPVIREKVCPVGYTDEGNDCAVFQPAVPVCPPDFTLSNDSVSCEHIETTPAYPVCADGGHLVGDKCEKVVEPGPKKPFCPEGERINKKECKVITYLPVDYECPEGFKLSYTPEGPICTAEISYDCSITKYECKDEIYSIKKPNVHAKGKAYSKKYPSSLGRYLHSMEKNNLSHKHTFCDTKKVHVPKTCTATKTADALPICPDHSVFNGEACEVVNIFPAEKKCVGTVLPDGRCVLIETYYPVYECPEKYSPSEYPKTCEQVTIVGVDLVCPDGTVEFQGQCAIFVPKECPIEGCEQTVVFEPQPVCPIDFTLTIREAGYKHHYYQQTTCVRKLYTEKLSKCPEGFMEINPTTCARLEPKKIVDEEENVVPQFFCPLGFAITPDNQCERITYTEGETMCDAPFQPFFDTDLCKNPVAPVLECPWGAKELDGECHVVVKVQPYYVEKNIMAVPHAKGHMHYKKAYPKKWSAKKWY